MGSINSLTGLKNVDFASLQDVASGKYNKGEIALKTGQDGTLSFGKVNNSVFKTWNNDVTAARIQNGKTNAAVFKAILTHYAGDASIDNVLSKNVSELKDDAFSQFSNPYIKEAFNFLMTGDAKGDPLSRDEMRFLFKLLDEGAGGNAGQVADNMKVLRALHTYKTKGGEAVDATMRAKLETVRGNDSIIKGLSVSNFKSGEVKKVTVNAAAAEAHKSAPKNMMQRIVAARHAAAGGAVGATESAAGANPVESVKPKFSEEEIQEAKKYLDDKQKELDDKLSGITTSGERRKCINAHVMRCLADEKYIAACGKFKRYTTGRDFFNDPKNQGCFNEVVTDSRENQMQKDQYIRFSGKVYTNSMIKEIQAMFPNIKNIAAYIFADATRCGCGLTWDYNTQEEASLRDGNAAEIIGAFIDHGIVDRGTPADEKKYKAFHQYNYTESKQGDLPVSPASEGFTTEVDLQRVDNEDFESKGATSFVFRAGASFQADVSQSDINGSVQYLCDSWLLNDGVDVSDKESRQLAKKFIMEFKERVLSEDSTTQKEAMAIATCAGLNASFDVFDLKDVDKLLKIVQEKSIDGSTEAYQKLLDKSRKNYYETLRIKIRADIVKAREEGNEVFIVGGIGCGTFGNDINEVAKILAEELFNHGGNMKAAFAGDDDLRGPFDKAYEKVCLQNGMSSSLKLDEVKANPSAQAKRLCTTLSVIADLPKSAAERYSLMETALKGMYKELFIGSDENSPEYADTAVESAAKLLCAGDRETNVLEANGLLCKTLRLAVQSMADDDRKTALNSFIDNLEYALDGFSGVTKFDVTNEMLASRAKILENPQAAANQLAQNLKDCAVHSKTYTARGGIKEALSTQLGKMFTDFSAKDKIDDQVKKRLRDMVTEKRTALDELSKLLVDSYDAENMKKGCEQLKKLLNSAIETWRDCFKGAENDAQHEAFKAFVDNLTTDLMGSAEAIEAEREERLANLVITAKEEIDQARIADDQERIEDERLRSQMEPKTDSLFTLNHGSFDTNLESEDIAVSRTRYQKIVPEVVQAIVDAASPTQIDTMLSELVAEIGRPGIVERFSISADVDGTLSGIADKLSSRDAATRLKGLEEFETLLVATMTKNLTPVEVDNRSRSFLPMFDAAMRKALAAPLKARVEYREYVIGQNPYDALNRFYDKIAASMPDQSAVADFLNAFLKLNFPGSSLVFKEGDDMVSDLADPERFDAGMHKLYDFLHEIHGFDDGDEQLTRNDDFLAAFEQKVNAPPQKTFGQVEEDFELENVSRENVRSQPSVMARTVGQNIKTILEGEQTDNEKVSDVGIYLKGLYQMLFEIPAMKIPLDAIASRHVAEIETIAAKLSNAADDSAIEDGVVQLRDLLLQATEYWTAKPDSPIRSGERMEYTRFAMELKLPSESEE